jgi:hippurate hydrolase
MTPASEELLRDAKELLPRAVALRRRIHQHPELGLDLPETKRAILEELDGLDLQIRESARTSGLVVTLEGGRPGPTLVLRGDMDALPMPEDTGLSFGSKVDGAMHACGHDAHVSMLAGAARLLEARRDQLAGKVAFMFQPGEEGHHGARIMLEEGLLDGADAAFAIHIFPLLPVGMVACRRGPILAAADEFRIELKGKGGHASMPHDTLDPIPAACELVQALQTFVTRRTNAFDPVIVTVGTIRSGTARNVIPENAVLGGTIRSVSEESRAVAHEGIDRVARGIAIAHGLEVDVELLMGYPVTVNHDAFTDFAFEAARELLGSDRVVVQPNPAMGAEDWSYVLQKIPGCMMILGVRPVDSEPAPCHSNRMVLNEEGMVPGIALHSAVALRYLDGQKRPFVSPA